MHFTKMHGIGNDYVYVDGSKEHIEDPGRLAQRISDRHFGIGSDGLILINPSSEADFEMEMYNADGSRGAMCGNGIRCVGKYVYDHGLTDKTEVRILTLSGIKTVALFPGEDGRIERARVDMGEPVLEPGRIPVKTSLIPGRSGKDEEKEPVIAAPCLIGGGTHSITCVSMGNPHCVTFTEQDVYELNLEEIGPSFERSPLFPERVNTEFVNVLSRDHLRMRVYERGSGETWACGTGACAVAVAAVLNGLAERRVTVTLRGGDLLIEWDETTGHVFMTGPAEEVYQGDICL